MEEMYKPVEDYIKETWGDNWLTVQWDANDVITALDEYAGIVERRSCEKCAMSWTKTGHPQLREVTDEEIDEIWLHANDLSVSLFDIWYREQMKGGTKS